MKFVGYCSSVMKSFGSNFASFISTEEKLITPETEDLLNLSDVKSVKMLSQMLSNKLFNKALLYYGSSQRPLIGPWQHLKLPGAF